MLESVVSSSIAEWNILLLHRPIQETEINHEADRRIRQMLQEVLKNNDVVLSGHNHLYERRNQIDNLKIEVGDPDEEVFEPRAQL